MEALSTFELSRGELEIRNFMLGSGTSVTLLKVRSWFDRLTTNGG
jgi:hypothetical protein